MPALEKRDGLEILNAISRLVEPLKPPVAAFEDSIRRTPFRILVSVLLSSRTKDPVTAAASEKLFAAAPTAAEMAALPVEKIAGLIYPVGFYRQKAQHIRQLAGIIAAAGAIPGTFEGLTALPGVGRKTANLVLALAFDRPAIAVDTHVFRISRRLGWARSETPEGVEKELQAVFPAEQWARINRDLVGFGQTICKPQAPLCNRCTITAACDYFHQRQGNLAS